MTSLPKLVFSIILILVLIQSGHAKTSTENLIVEKSDILNLKKSTEIEEGDFVEDIQVNLDNFVWIVNLKNGPFPTQEKAKQIALALKKTLGLTLAGLLKEISIVRELKSPKSKNFNQAEFSWAVNFRLGAYNSKDKALQIVQKLKITQKSPENVFLTRESSNVKTPKFAENVQTKVFGEIFLTREVNPTKDKTEHLILITTRSNSLNVRKNPSSSSPVVASLLKGSKVPHIEKNASRNSNRNWFYVEYSKGKFGWVSSSYSKKIIDLDSRISQQTNLKTIIPEKLLIGKAPTTSQFRELKSVVALLRTELDKIKSDKTRAIEAAAHQANVRALEIARRANAKAKEEKLASIKEFKNLKEKSSAELMGLQTTTASLRSELDQIKSDRARVIEANARMEEEKLASVNEKNALKEKINTLRVVLDKFKIDKDKTNQANAKAKEEKLASVKEFESLKEKSSAEIKGLQTTTVSLRSELKKIKSDKARAINATDQTSAKLQSEKLANAKIIASLKAENKKEIDDLKLITASLQKELQKTRVDEAKSIEASNQANAKIRAGDLRSIEFQNKLKDTVIFLRKELDQVKSDKTRATEATNQTHEKLNAEKLANSDKINRLKKTSDREIKNLNTTIKNLRTVLEKFETEKRKTVETRKSLERKTETERILSTKKINNFKNESTALKLQLGKANLDRIKAIEAINRNDRKTQADQRALENEFNTFKQESEIEIASLRGVTESLRKQLTQLKAEKTRSTQTETLLSSSKNPQEPTDSKRTKRKNKHRATSDTLPKDESDNQGGSTLSSTEIVTSHLFNWAKAWESRNVPLYLSFYSKSFKDPKRSRSKWETYRRRSLKNTLNISIELLNIKAFIYRKNSIKVTFIQRFKSNKLSDIGIKELFWKKDANGWKIIKETWRPR